MTPHHNDWPRRSDLGSMTDIELWIRALVHEVESQGAHPILTDTVILLGDAQERFADWVDAGKPGAAS